jgi:Ca-activated chloride channel family protein
MPVIRHRAIGLMLVMLLLGSGVAAAAADTPTDAAGRAPRRVTEGTLLWRVAGQKTLVPAPVLDTDVDLHVTGTLARATVRQAFTNPSAEWAEGVYVFPLPDDAAVDHLRMQVGDRIIEGVIQERTAAKETYERAKQEGKRTSLVEQERPNIFTTSVANIPPGAAITVEIQYQHVVRYDDGRWRLRFPMVVGPRYMPGAPQPGAPAGDGWSPDTDQVPDASRISPPVRDPARGLINPVRLRVALVPGVPLLRLESPYHPIRTAQRSDGSYEVTLGQDTVPADRDFELMWQPRAGTTPTAAVLTERVGEETFALMIVVPPAPPSVEAQELAREVIFVVDNSGSMAGASIEQAKAALKLALARLQPTDTFNLIRFNHTTDSLFPSAEPASPNNVQWAERYVSGLVANGGTEMLPALLRALDGQEHPDRLRQVIFLTDGAVGNEERLFAAIVARLGDSRLFTIGIGSAPNGHFMREAARYGRGTFTYIGSVTEVGEKMTALFRKLESPALTDLRLELDGGVPAEVFPDQIPDLYVGEPVVVSLRALALPARAVLHGRLGGMDWQREVPLQQTTEGAGIAVHWARAKIAALLDTRRPGAAEVDTRRAVIDIAMKHHLVSRYTSLVAVDVTPARAQDATLHRHALETNLPHGWEYTAVFGLGQGATDAALHAMLGAIALLAASALYLMLRYDIALARPRRDRHGA